MTRPSLLMKIVSTAARKRRIQDEFDINLVLMPGVTDAGGTGGGSLITKAIDMCEDRGDCFPASVE